MKMHISKNAKENKLIKLKKKIEKHNACLLDVVDSENIKKIIYKVKCSKGHSAGYTYSQISGPYKQFCKICTKANRLTHETAQKNLENKNFTLLSVYGSHKHPVDVKCLTCGHIFSKVYNKIVRAKFPCERCHPRPQMSEEFIKAICASHGFLFIEETKKYEYKVKCKNCDTSFSKNRRLLKKKICPCPHCAGLAFDESMVLGVIYKLVSPSGKVYIGQTIQPVQDRFRGHSRSSNDTLSPSYDTRIGTAIRKYGIDNFDIFILYSKVPWNQLDGLEKKEILNHKSTDVDLGYNLAAGGRPNGAAAHAVVRRYEKRIQKNGALKMKAEKKRAMSFGRNMEIAIKDFYKQKASQVDYEMEKMKESVRRSMSAKKFHAAGASKTSRFVGVCWDKQIKKWKANIKHKQKKIHLGVFCDEIEAAKAYDKAALKYHKDKAKFNFKS